MGRFQAVRRAAELLPRSELVLYQLGSDALALNRPRTGVALRVNGTQDELRPLGREVE